MNKSPRLLVGVAAAVVLALAAAACDTSPYAASVGGQVIKETALNAELRALSANTAYIKAIDEGGASSGSSVKGVAPGTYSTAWTAHVLTGMVAAVAVHSRLVARHDLPTPADLTAARAVESADYGPLWDGFPAAYRTTLTERQADLAMIESASAPSSTVKAAYDQFRNYFFDDVCVRTVAVSVSSANGSVDYQAARSQAEALVGRVNSAGHHGAGLTSGSVTCYALAQFEQQPQAFTTIVLGLATGKAAPPVRTGYGYEVVAVSSRAAIPLGQAMSKALSVAITAQSDDPAVERLLGGTRVQVNPVYGRWGGSTSKGWSVTAPSARTTS